MSHTCGCGRDAYWPMTRLTDTGTKEAWYCTQCLPPHEEPEPTYSLTSELRAYS